MKFILAVDVGTTNVKAALIGEDYQIASLSTVASPKIEGRSGGSAGHKAVELREAILQVCRAAVGSRGSEVCRLVVTSYQFGLLLADAKGRPITEISNFEDTSAQTHYPRFLKDLYEMQNLDSQALYERTGCPPIFQYQSNRLHYIGKTDPNLLRHTRHVWDSKAFVMAMLTGVPVTEYSTANATQCLDISGNWDEKIIQATGFQSSYFPRVLDGTRAALPLREEICKQLGLPKQIPVQVGLYDGAALAASLSGFKENIAIANFGTSGMFRVPMSSPKVDTQDGVLQSCLIYPKKAENAGLYLNGAGISNVTNVTNWLRKNGMSKGLLEKHHTAFKHNQQIFCFPYLNGERDADIGCLATGVIFGLRNEHTAADQAQAVKEGVAFSFLFVKQHLDPDNKIKELSIAGGGSRNSSWMKILAEVLNVKVSVAKDAEMGLIGSALLARSAFGHERIPLQSLSTQINRKAKLITPDPGQVEHYKELSERYFAVRKMLRIPLQILAEPAQVRSRLLEQEQPLLLKQGKEIQLGGLRA